MGEREVSGSDGRDDDAGIGEGGTRTGTRGDGGRVGADRSGADPAIDGPADSGAVLGREVDVGDARPLDERAADGAEDDDAGVLDRYATEEAWSPPASAARGTAVLGQYLAAGESLRRVDDGLLLGERLRPAAVGVTDERFVAVTEDGEFVGVGHDRLCSVRSRRQSSLGLRGADARLLLGAGFLLSLVGFLGVLVGAADPLTPTLAVVAVGGFLAADAVRRLGVDSGLQRASVPDLGVGLADRVERAAARFGEEASADAVAAAAVAAVALASFAILLVLEPGLVAPAWVVVTAAGATLTVYAFRHADELDGIELVRRPHRTVRATVEDGTAVEVRVRPDSALARELSALAGASNSSGSEDPPN